MMTKIEWKTKPWKHQLEAYERFKDKEFCALMFEQRCGKSLSSLMIATHKFKKGEIDSLLVIAPNGVQRNWAINEIPEHLPIPYRCVLWQSSKMDSKKAIKELADLLEYREGLRVLCVNVDALITKKFRDYLTKFFMRRKVMAVVDECFVGETEIATPTGDVPIKDLKIGDSVLTSIGHRKITKKFRRSSQFFIKICLSDSRKIICTPNEPIFTDLGWVCAGNLGVGAEVYGEQDVRNLLEPVNETWCNSVLFERMRYRTKEEIKENFLQLQRLREGNHRFKRGDPVRTLPFTKGWTRDTRGSSLTVDGDSSDRVDVQILSKNLSKKTLQELQNTAILQRILRSEADSIRPVDKGKDLYQGDRLKDKPRKERKEPWSTSLSLGRGEERRNKVKASREEQTSSRFFHLCSRWQRTSHTKDDLEVDDHIRLAVATGTRHRIGKTAARLSNQLQGRPGLDRNQDGNRGRWFVSPFTEGQGTRQEKRTETSRVRVVSITRITHADPVDVYDLEIEGCPHFYANGILVHNSSDISNDKAARTKMAVKIGRRAKVRMILDGTPVAAGPMGLFSQCDFLAPGALDYTSFVAFRARYAELEPMDVGEKNKLCPVCYNAPREEPCERCKGVGHIGNRQIQVIKRYLNLDELTTKLARFSARVVRSDVHDMPPKVRQKIYFDLPPDPRRVYDELRRQYLTELKSGTVITAALVLTRYLRLQQVASGFLPVPSKLVECPACQSHDAECPACEGLGVTEDLSSGAFEPIGASNARLEALTAQLEKLDGQCLVWCRFTYDVDAVLAWLKKTGRTAVRYDGKVKDEERALNVAAFQSRQARYFVGSARAGGRGLDLPADVVCYFSHEWSLRTRLQSEDRAQSLKRALAGEKQASVLYLDVVATDTVDEKIVDALRAGKRLSDLITGDKIEEWL